MSVTKTFRFPEDLEQRLQRAAARLARKPNAIMIKALDDYLRRLERQDLAAEARRQSLLVSGSRVRDEFWERAANASGWK